MTLTTSQCTTYVGRLEDLPANASPGLLYLKAYFQVLKSPQPAIEQLQTILALDAVFTHNEAAPISAFPQACTVSRTPSPKAHEGFLKEYLPNNIP
jgi:hypothetical protein